MEKLYLCILLVLFFSLKSQAETVCPHNRVGKNCQDGCHCNYYGYCYRKSCDCAAGWTGYSCNEECPTGTFGYNCLSPCHCADNSKCNKTNGRCQGVKCENGYTGYFCQTECPTGTFGEGCQGKCNCSTNSKCNKTDGRCQCEKGYTGRSCQTTCDNGTFGHACNLKCHCDKNSQCNHINGTCLDGKCADGFKGKNCQEVISSLTLPLVLTAVLIIIISIGLGIVCYRWRNSKRRNDSKNQEYENIPMERGISQETRGDNPREEDIDPENIYDTTYVLTKNILLSYVQQNKKEEEYFSTEFTYIFNDASINHPCRIAKLQENIRKNRNNGSLPYDHSRVILGNGKNGYINASYIDEEGKYIATQGPLETTKNDFWRMIWQLGSNTIVMLTNIVEKGKVKCSWYMPDLDKTENYGPFQICCVQQDNRRIYTHRVLIVTENSTQEKRSVHHFHCTIWPDYDIIEEATLFLEFRNAIRRSPFSKPPFVVHCSTGAGRTGVYIVLDILLDEILKKDTFSVFNCVNKMSRSRPSMFTRLKQYQFIYDVLAEEILTGFSEIPVYSIPDEFKKLQTMKADGNISILESQYKDFLSPLNKQNPRGSNLEEPTDNVLWYEDFPEPTFIDGFYMKNEIILMPHPRKNSAEMFWKFIYKRRCSVIVMFEDSSNVHDDYWTQVHSLSINMIEDNQCEKYAIKKFHITNQKDPISVTFIRIKTWIEEEIHPSIIIEVINTLNDYYELGKPLLIHCKDGVTRSGIFAVMHMMIMKIKLHEPVSLLRLLRYIKRRNPEIATNVSSYKLCWSVAEMFHNTSIYDDALSIPLYIDIY